MINRDDLILNYNTGNLLETICACLLTDYDDCNILSLELATLHNEGLIDIVEAFKSLKNDPSNSLNFFRIRNVFEKTLPELEAPVSSVMRCILRLYQEAGQDFLAYTIINSFIEFLKKSSLRPSEALTEIETNPEDLSDLLPASLIAGFCCEPSFYLKETIRLCKDKNIVLRRQAVFSLGKFVRTDGNIFSEDTFVALECSATDDTDDQILAGIVKSAFSILQQQEAQELRIITLIETVLSKGNEYTLQIAAQIFGIDTDKLTDKLLDVLLIHLRRVKASNKTAIEYIDYGIQHMLKSGNIVKAVQLLEDILLSHPDELTMEVFDSAAREILNNKVLMSKILTRWFLRGDRVLCDGVYKIVELHHGNDLLLEVNPDELNPEDLSHMIFVARKAVGYLFFKPISAASILVSLMRKTTDNEMVTELGRLLFDPLLLNFTGNLREYLLKQSEQESGEVKVSINRALDAIENYLDDLRAVGELAALHPGEMQRQAYNRHNTLAMSEVWKKVVVKSVMLNLVQKTVLLYGRKAIGYVHSIDGQTPLRIETPLQSYGTEIEVPRMEYLDPFGLDYMLRIFRVEKLNS